MQSYLKPLLGVALAAGIVAAAQAQTPFAKTEDAIRYRQSALFIMGQHFGRIGKVVKGEHPYDKQEVVKNATIAEEMSKLPWDAFVPGSDKGKTRAKPEIWTEQTKFKSDAEKMQKEMAKLAAVATDGDLNAIKAQFGATGKACKACHDDFRKKE